MTEKREIKINGLTEAELYFVSEFAHKTEDAGLIDKLISEFEEKIMIQKQLSESILQ